MTFSETTLFDAIKTAHPGQRLDFKDVPGKEMKDAVRLFSGAPKEALAGKTINLGSHVDADTKWWGVEVKVDHQGMQTLQAGSAAALLVTVGVAPFVAGIIAGVVGIWSVFDKGNGVCFYVTWAGVHWFSSL
jgi:hypothetical protein